MEIGVNEKKRVPANVVDRADITYESDTPANATVDKNGIVKGIAAGSATITIKQNGNAIGTIAVTVA